MNTVQRLVGWLNEKENGSNLLKVKSRAGSLMRRLFPAWPGLSSLLLRLRRRLFGSLVRCDVNQFKLYVDVRDRAIGHYLLNSFPYEPEETELLLKLLQPGMTFLDVGANIGYFTVLAAERVGASGHVIAFEPEPHNFEILEKNVAANGLSNVRLENLAAADEAGELTLYLSTYNFGDHRVFESDDDSLENLGRRHHKVSVRAVSLDEYLDSRGHRPDLIKIDVQGAEPGVLRGLRRTLKRPGQVRHMLMEFWPAGIRSFGADPLGMLDELQELGFELYQMQEAGGLTRFEVEDAGALQGSRAYTNLYCRRSSEG